MNKLDIDFYSKDVLQVAPFLLGKTLARKYASGAVRRFTITEVEIYRGEEDKACHASKGRTPRTEVMYQQGGLVYVYLIYGMYWLFNIVTGDKDSPQAVLIRGVDDIVGPGKVGRLLELDKSFYGEDIAVSERIWIEDAPLVNDYKTAPRVGIAYASEYWRNIEWRLYYSLHPKLTKKRTSKQIKPGVLQ